MSTTSSILPSASPRARDGLQALLPPATYDAVKAVASLKLTVALFALCMFLVFAGTLAQIDQGIWGVMTKYFRSFWTRIDLHLFFPRAWNIPGWFPFPGGWTLGALLLANLFAAHAIRFRVQAIGPAARLGTGLTVAGLVLLVGTPLTSIHSTTAMTVLGTLCFTLLTVGCAILFRKRGGIVLLHGGIIVMLLAELLTGLYALESRMLIATGSHAHFTQDSREFELALTWPAKGAGGGGGGADKGQTDLLETLVIHERALTAGAKIALPDLPMDVEILRYMSNSELVDLAQAPDAPKATQGKGLRAAAKERAIVAGTSSEQTMDAPSAYVRLLDKKTGAELGVWLLSFFLDPQPVTAGEGPAAREYQLSLRPRRYHKPYAMHLKEFRHDLYEGTQIPRNFSSRIRIVNPATHEDREVTISMNNPLRYAGETFFQSGWLPGDSGTILQVVRNPAWWWPYLSCALVAAGMVWHFGATASRLAGAGAGAVEARRV